MRNKLLFLALFLFCFFGFSVQAKVYKIAMMRQRGPDSLYLPMVDGFREALDVMEKARNKKVDFMFDREYSADKEGGQAAAADAMELLDKGVDLIVTVGSAPTIGARKVLQRTSVPQIYMAVSDPEGQGLISAIGKPSGTNITGVSYFLPPSEELKFIKQILPLAKVCVYAYDSTVTADLARKVLFENLKYNYDLEIKYHDISTEELRQDFSAMEGIDVVTGWLGYAILKQKGVPLENPAGSLCLGVGTKEYVEEWGGLAAIIMDGFAVGQQAGVMAAKLVTEEETIENILPEDPKKLITIINLKKALEEKIDIPFEVLVKAKEIIK